MNMSNNKEERTTLSKWSRRAFIGVGSLAGVGLVAGVGGFMYAKRKVRRYSGYGMGDGDSLNAWIRIAPDNTVTIAVARAEMGQGVYTAVPQLIAEELEVEMDKIRVIHPQPESPYANTYLMTQEVPNIFKAYTAMETIYAALPVIGTGGSTTIIDAYNNMRYAGATAREMLLTAAGNRWQVDKKDCFAEKGEIINRKSQERFSYGALAVEAGQVELADLPELKAKKDFKIIGKSVQRLDLPEKVNGKAIYGLDVRLENLHYAAVSHPSTIGGRILSIDNENEVLKMPGVKKVLISEFGPAIVIADNTWRAINAAKALKKQEDLANKDLSTDSIKKEIEVLMKSDPIEIRVNEGDTQSVFNNPNGEVVTARYDVPYLAHATMEPMNCTVMVKDGKCECWVGHQAPSVVMDLLKESTGVSKSNTILNTTYLGGGFGRRSEPDFVRIAGSAAKAFPGVPVQLVFSREEDMQNDPYRPMAACEMKAVVSKSGDIEAFESMSILQSTERSALNRIMPIMAPPPEKDKSTVEGIAELPYLMKNKKVAFGDLDLPVQIGFWRSVGFSQNSFFAESFMDECAHSADVDPYLFRKSKLKKHPRFEAVLDKVADMSNWKEPLPEGTFRGIALVKSFGSIVGEVAEISQVGEKEFKIDKYYCAIDCGNVVNPDIITTQMQSGIIFGLTAALYGNITWKDGAVEQTNFHNYEMVRMNVCPKIEVSIMDVDEYPGGVGEPATPPAAPALANALFAATGVRTRSLPLTEAGYTFV